MKKLRHVTLFDQTTRFRHVPWVGQTTRLKHAAWVGQTTRLRHVTLVIPCTALLLWRSLLALLPFGDIQSLCVPMRSVANAITWHTSDNHFGAGEQAEPEVVAQLNPFIFFNHFPMESVHFFFRSGTWTFELPDCTKSGSGARHHSGNNILVQASLFFYCAGLSFYCAPVSS